MFRISRSKVGKDDCIEIENTTKKNAYLKINLNQGASLQELALKGSRVIQDMYPLEYKDTYASAILFPFANRVKDGRYHFENNTYQLEVNEKKLDNALHGLVYNKTFTLVDQEETNELARVKLVYSERDYSKGFPFPYSIFLDYELSECDLKVKVQVKNVGSKAFPFTIGWHPYFISEDLSSSSLVFESNKKTETDSRNITTRVLEIDNIKELKTDKQGLDDCYVLNSKKIKLFTPEYVMTLESSEEDCFLQLYTPPFKNAIAIEPTTGISDSFNNKIGLKKLRPSDSYDICWSLNVKNRKNKE